MSATAGRNTSPWVPIYQDDLVAATHWWHPAAFGVYMRLLMHQAAHGSVPNDWQGEIRAIAGGHHVDDVTWHKIVEQVAPKFETGEDGCLRNARLQTEMDIRNATRETAIANGGKGGRPRKTQKETQTVTQKKPRAKGTTSTTTSTTTDVVVVERQLELATGLVATAAGVHSSVNFDKESDNRNDDDDDNGVGRDREGEALLSLMGLPIRPLSADEKATLDAKRSLLSTEALERLAAWYPNGRRRGRREPDALIYLLHDLEQSLDKSARQSLPKKRKGATVPEAFKEWLATADLGQWEALRGNERNAWMCAAVRELYRKEAAASA